MKRIAILVDGSNAYASGRALGFKIDYVKFLRYFADKYDVNRALYFTALPPKTENSPLRNMSTFLQHNGYTLVTKDTTDYITRDGTPKRKGNMDCEIIISMIKTSTVVDELVLFSGDGDFRCAVEYVQELGQRVTVVSTLKGSMVSDQLRKQADAFIDLADIRQSVEHVEVVKTTIRRKFFTLGG